MPCCPRRQHHLRHHGDADAAKDVVGFHDLEATKRKLVNADDVGCLYVLGQVYSVLFNTTDPRFWIKRGLIVLTEFVLLIVTLALNWELEIPRYIMLAALCLLTIEPFLVLRAYWAICAQHDELTKDFKQCDVDGDGILNPQEAAEFLKDYPQFRLRYNKNQFYTLNDVRALLRHRKRTYFRPLLELSISWASFFATLMIHEPGSVDAASLVLGYIGVLDVLHVLHRLCVVYMSRFSTTELTRLCCCGNSINGHRISQLINRLVYYTTIFALTGVLLAGFAIVNAFSAANIDFAAGPIPNSEAVGFVVGWVLLACVVIALCVVFIYFQVLRCVGIVERRKDLEVVDMSSPQFVLSTLNPRFAV